MAVNYQTYRIDDIVDRMRMADLLNPIDAVITGVTGAGKSTTLNSFFRRSVARVGEGVDPETMDITAYKLNDRLRFWDTPGLGDGVERDRIHARKIIDLLYKTYESNGLQYGFIDLALIIIEGSNRDLGSTYRLLNDVIVPNIQSDRILVAINQADAAMKGRHWNYVAAQPDAVLKTYLEEQAVSVQRRVREATGVLIQKPVYYSAQYGYNVERLFDFIIDNIPHSKRKI